jgi:hypothetical protein
MDIPFPNQKHRLQRKTPSGVLYSTQEGKQFLIHRKPHNSDQDVSDAINFLSRNGGTSFTILRENKEKT